MVDVPGSTRDPAERPPTEAKLRPMVSRRSGYLIVLGALVLVAAVLFQLRPRSATAVPSEAPAVDALATMRAPLLGKLPALPASAAVAEQRPAITAMLGEGQRPSLLTGIDAGVLAWVEALEAGDHDHPPLPQRVSADDVGRRLIGPGQPLLVSGRLEDLAPAAVDGGEGGWRWLSLVLAEGQYALVLTRDGGPEVVLNDRVDVVGRYLGRIEVATADAAQEMALIAGRTVTPAHSDAVVVPEGMREFYGALRLPDDVYRGVDDELPLVETRAYYYTIGQIKLEGATPQVFAGALDANQRANDIHQRPDEFRGRACTVRGRVYHAWEDEQIAADKPFDVRRVARILLYQRDVGPITENGVTQTKSVLRLYELALVGDQPLPQRGDTIEASGRFVKWRAITVDRNRPDEAGQLVAAGPGKVYSMFFVVPSYRRLEVETINWMPARIGLIVISALIVIAIAISLHRDRGAERRLRDSVARLRETRRKAGPRSGPRAADPVAGDAEVPPGPGEAR